MIVYTSGTTGPPKGAMISHRNVIWTNQALGQSNPIYEIDEILSFLPLCHIAERNMTTFSSLTYGQVVNFAESLETVPADIREISPHIFFAVPRIWEKFYSSIVLQMKDSTWLEKKIFAWAKKVGEETARKYLVNEKKPRGKFAISYPIAKALVFNKINKFFIFLVICLTQSIINFWFHI